MPQNVESIKDRPARSTISFAEFSVLMFFTELTLPRKHLKVFDADGQNTRAQELNQFQHKNLRGFVFKDLIIIFLYFL